MCLDTALYQYIEQGSAGKIKKPSSKTVGIIQMSEKFCPHAALREEDVGNVCNTAYGICQWQN